MPCHVDTIDADAAKQQIDKIVLVAKGKIRVQRMGDNFYGKYPTVDKLVCKYRAKYKTFQYKVDGTMLVVVTPCPKGC